jgi:Na+/phosphate symporter
MDYQLEQHRDYFAPIIYECVTQLYEKIKANNDMITYYRWKELVSLFAYNNSTITFACNMFLNSNKEMPHHEEYKSIIMIMLTKYEQNGFNRNRS